MATPSSALPSSSWNLVRSIGAIIVGVVVAAGFATLTDLLMHRLGLFPSIGQPMADRLFYVAAAYRLVYSILGTYVMAVLAPHRPMLHAMIGGFLGLFVSIIGAVATWNHVPPLGPHWYSLSLVVTALPSAWVGGKLRLTQLRRGAAASAPSA